MTPIFRIPIILAASTLALAACAQTGGGTAASVNPPLPGTVLVGTLLGAGEVPPGDPDGNGEFTGFFDQAGGKLCYDIGVGSLDKITVMHIHSGAAQVAGPPVITLATPDGTHGEGCIAVDRALLGQIIANPAGYYVNVHTTTHPTGAIRSQLMRPS
jgi:hypothetical protein